MFTTVSQRVCFVIGFAILAWLAVAKIADYMNGNFHEALIGPLFVGGIVAIFWHFTGVLTPVIKWFKGK